jgi:hypothetical protein
MESSRVSENDRQLFALGWLRVPARPLETIGSVTLPDRPTTLGEARGGLQMVGGDEKTACWLQTWAESDDEERNIALRLPGGWFELHAATIRVLPGASARYVVRFDRRSPSDGPAT